MESFSQRQGFKPTKKTMQINSIDEDLRNSLWNALCIFCWAERRQTPISKFDKTQMLVQRIYLDYFKKPTDTIRYWWNDEYDVLREYFYRARWNEVYDFIEFVGRNQIATEASSFRDYVNQVLEREFSGYRFIGEKIAPITSSEEIAEIEKAIQVTDTLKPVAIHLSTAVDLLADRKSPDYRNY